MHHITIALATRADSRDLFEWRNEPDSRRASKNSAPIEWETHTAWFAAALVSPERTIYIGYRGSKKIGCIRFDRMRTDVFLVSIVVAPAERGRGFGHALLRSGVAVLPGIVLEAEIAADNLASQRIFEACGFERILTESNNKFLRYRRRPAASIG
jgi:RimJ/RimL family protein N-acetyltransferase